jgi:ribulose-phosphate 3-epimerase
MPPSSLIAPSILSADFARLGEQVRAADAAGAGRIHIDVMDGRFVPNITMGPLVVSALRPVTTLPLDVHLMIVEPERHIDAFADAGADIITVHLEASPNLHRTLQQIRALDKQAGVAINPHTPASALAEVLHMLNNIIVMTVNPGFGGQAFLPETMHKIITLREMLGGEDVDICVDGGIAAETITEARDAGANVFVAGSAVFGDADGVAAGIERLQQALDA